MKLQVKFNPAWQRDFPPGDRRLWVLRSLALRIQLQANPLWIFEVYYRRLLVALTVLGVTLWLLAATALFAWLNHTPHNQVRWLDLAAPWRWSGLRARRGDTAVLNGLDELKAKEINRALYNLRVGVARSPGNVEGRLALAALLAGSDPAGAVAQLEDGLPLCGNNPRYVEGLLFLYARCQIQSHALGVVAGLLQGGAGPLSPELRFTLQRTQAALLLQLNRWNEAGPALAAITAPTPEDAAVIRGMQIELLLHTGRAAEAKKLWDAQPAAAAAAPLRQAADIAIALDDADALQGALRRLKALAPEEPGAYLLAFQSWQRMKRLSYRDAAEQEYFRGFSRNDGAMQALAALAVNLDLPEVVARAQRVAVAAGHSPFAYRVHSTELALRRGDFAQAARHLADWENDVDTVPDPQRFYPEFIKRLTRTAVAGTPDQVSALLSHLALNRGQMLLPAFSLAVSVLEKSGNAAGAAQVLRAGRQHFPQSEPLLTAQARVDALVAAAAAKAAATKAAAAPVLVSLPTSAAAARDQLDGLLLQDSLAAAGELLRTIRQQQPAWLAELEPDLARREVELVFLTLDQVASRAAVRTYLDRYHTEPDLLRLVALVPRLVARNRPADARLLNDEISADAAATPRIRQALQDLNLADDLAAVAATQTATLAALDRGIARHEWPQADRLLKYLREKPPVWLPMGQVDVRVREVQVRLGSDQRLLALAALKDLTIKSGAPRSAAFKLVRDLLGRGERETAALLAREIARLLPGDPAAARLVRETEAPRPGA